MNDLNLPAPPKHHFWRVDDVMLMPRIQLRRKFLIGSLMIDAVIPENVRNVEQGLHDGAQAILNRLHRYEPNSAFLAEYGGDYS